jgi:hypothetical protein
MSLSTGHVNASVQTRTLQLYQGSELNLMLEGPSFTIIEELKTFLNGSISGLLELFDEYIFGNIGYVYVCMP